MTSLGRQLNKLQLNSHIMTNKTIIIVRMEVQIIIKYEVKDADEKAQQFVEEVVDEELKRCIGSATKNIQEELESAGIEDVHVA